MWNYRLYLGLIIVILTGPVAIAQDIPPCSERPYIADLPRVEPRLWCIERPIFDRSAGELSFTAIAFAPDGTLYATRPLTGELLALRDTDGDSLPDTPQVIADGLALPNGLAYADDTLYIVGDGHVYQYADETLTTIAADLPGGRGFMASAIAVYDKRLYVGIPMPCDFCEGDNLLHGTVVSVALDGTDRQVVARGLRYPAGITVYQDALWITDTARDGLREEVSLDEINRVDLGAESVPHFGFPYCVGQDNRPDMAGEFDCAAATAPAILLFSHSTPFALQPYTGAAFPFLRDDLLLVLSGSTNNSRIRGYQVVYVEQEADKRIIESILPYDRLIAGEDRMEYDPAQGYFSFFAERLNQRGAGVWPHRIFDIAISPEGWIYMSVGGGAIYTLRPGDMNACRFRSCDKP